MNNVITVLIVETIVAHLFFGLNLALLLIEQLIDVLVRR